MFNISTMIIKTKILSPYVIENSLIMTCNFLTIQQVCVCVFMYEMFRLISHSNELSGK
jgi:hypothetical protein